MTPTFKLSQLCEYYAPYYGVSSETLRNWCQNYGYSLKGLYTKSQARRQVFNRWAHPRGKKFISPKRRE